MGAQGTWTDMEKLLSLNPPITDRHTDLTHTVAEFILRNNCGLKLCWRRHTLRKQRLEWGGEGRRRKSGGVTIGHIRRCGSWSLFFFFGLRRFLSSDAFTVKGRGSACRWVRQATEKQSNVLKPSKQHYLKKTKQKKNKWEETEKEVRKGISCWSGLQYVKLTEATMNRSIKGPKSRTFPPPTIFLWGFHLYRYKNAAVFRNRSHKIWLLMHWFP